MTDFGIRLTFTTHNVTHAVRGVMHVNYRTECKRLYLFHDVEKVAPVITCFECLSVR